MVVLLVVEELRERVTEFSPSLKRTVLMILCKARTGTFAGIWVSSYICYSLCCCFLLAYVRDA